MLTTFSVEVEVGSDAMGSSYVGLSVDTPLPSRIGNTQNVIGIINLVPFVISRFNTTVTVNVGTGDHYVILGYEIPTNIIPAISWVRLKLSGAGTSVERTYSIFDVKHYIYISFNVGKNGAITPITSGQISPDGSPIQQPGGGGLFPSDFGDAVSSLMASMIQIMMPLMIMQMMMQMMAGLMTGITGVV